MLKYFTLAYQKCYEVVIYEHNSVSLSTLYEKECYLSLYLNNNYYCSVFLILHSKKTNTYGEKDRIED